MIYYFYTFRCRHAVFSKYFGDSPPLCKNKCDVCKNKDEVQARINQFEMCQTRSQRNLGTIMQTNYDNDDNDETYGKLFDLPNYIYNKIFLLCVVKLCLQNLYLFSNEFEESREKIMAAEKRERKELIIEQFALRRGASKEDEVSLL